MEAISVSHHKESGELVANFRKIGYNRKSIPRIHIPTNLTEVKILRLSLLFHKWNINCII